MQPGPLRYKSPPRSHLPPSFLFLFSSSFSLPKRDPSLGKGEDVFLSTCYSPCLIHEGSFRRQNVLVPLPQLFAIVIFVVLNIPLLCSNQEILFNERARSGAISLRQLNMATTTPQNVSLVFFSRIGVDCLFVHLSDLSSSFSRRRGIPPSWTWRMML